MTYYLSAYTIFWIVLVAYLGWLTARQAWLNRRAEALVRRLMSRGGESSNPGGDR